MKARFFLALSCLLVLSAIPIYSDENQAEISIASASQSNLQALSGEAIYNTYTSRKYLLGPNDVISLFVMSEPKFNQQDILIAPDGQITVAPFGTINLAGRTVDDVQAEMTNKLKFFLNDPKVQVKLEHTKPYQVNVLGAVLKPGPYELITDAFRNASVSNSGSGIILERKAPLLSNVLVAAGGLKEDADISHIQITNQFDHSRTEINMLDLLEKGDTTQDIFLIPGDVVSVPALANHAQMSNKTYKTVAGSTFFRNEIPVKVLGYVNRPGIIWLPSAQSTNVNSAIAKAGGFLNEAPYPTTRVYISRADEAGHLNTQVIDPRQTDIMLRPNDVVYVTDKFIPKMGRAFDYLGRLVSPLAAIASSYNAILYSTGANTTNSGSGKKNNPVPSKSCPGSICHRTTPPGHCGSSYYSRPDSLCK